MSKAPLMRADGRQLDSDMRNADEERAQAQAAIDLYIEESKVKHRNWNQAYEDLTWRPITPPLEMANRGYRQVYTGAADSQGLPTPPASIASEESADKMDVDAETTKAGTQQLPVVRYASPPADIPPEHRPSFRRRFGRGGRLWIDRRNLKRPLMDDSLDEPDDDQTAPAQSTDVEIDERKLDREAFDRDSDEEDIHYPVDHNSDECIKYRVWHNCQTQIQAQAMRRAIAASEAGASNNAHLHPSAAGRAQIQAS